VEASVREKRSLVLYNELNSNWEKELYTEVCTHEARRGTAWWKMGIWRLKCVRGNTDQGVRPICSKEEGWSHILRYKGTRIWRDKLLDKRFTSNDPEVGIRRTVANKDKDKVQKTELYLSKYKEKRKRLVKKYED
jgi:hypothetical protein